MNPQSPPPFDMFELQRRPTQTSISSLSDSASEERPEPESSYLFRYSHLDRKLKRPQITGIAFSGTIGIGLFISSGEFIGISGSVGTVIGFVIAGFIVISVMRCLAELVSVNPVFSALMEYPHTFVDPALGFAVGVTYCLAQCMSMAALTSSAARVANNFQPEIALQKSQTAGIIIGLVLLTLLSNACGVTIYGTIERVVKWIKLCIILSLCILMIVVNLSAGRTFTGSRHENITSIGVVPGFVPSGIFNATLQEEDIAAIGISGPTGSFLAIWTSITLAMFACMGGDIVIVTAGEALRPRRDLPAVTRFMYLAPISFYVLGSFLVGFNINYTDPELAHPYRNPTSHNFESASPFIIVLRNCSVAPNVLPTLFSALFLFSAYTAANTGLFAASRTLFGLARTYGNDFLMNTVGRTNRGHTPLTAIILCSIFGLLSFLGLADDTFNQPVLSLSSFFTGAVGCVYGSECIAYLRFWDGLRKLEKLRQPGRNDDSYKQKHYRAHWQPMWAILGLIGCTLCVLFSGWPAIYIMRSRQTLQNGDELKPDRLLAWDLVGAYSGPVIFLSLFFGYKIVNNTRIQHFEDWRKFAYNPPEFDDDNDVPDARHNNWKYWVKEIWSFIE